MSQYGVTRRHLGDAAVSPNKVLAAFFDGSYVLEKFNYQPQSTTAANSTTGASGFTAPTGVTGDSNIIRFRDPVNVHTHVKGTQTILGPIYDTTGQLDVSQDQTNGDGIEWVFGGEFTTLGSNPLGFVARSSARRFARLKIRVPAVAAITELAFGFRRTQAGQAALASYTDFAALSMLAGAIRTKTQLNTGGVTTGSTLVTAVDTQTFELRVEVDETGNAYFYIDGKQYGLPFQFDSGDGLVPFFFFLQSATPGKIYFVEFESGLLSVVDDKAADQF